jgi:hypothetical protein
MEFLLGSVSNQVAHHCTRPVVLLHARKAHAAAASGAAPNDPAVVGPANYSSGSDSS